MPPTCSGEAHALRYGGGPFASPQMPPTCSGEAHALRYGLPAPAVSEERNDPPSKSGAFRYATGGTELGTSPDSKSGENDAEKESP